MGEPLPGRLTVSGRSRIDRPRPQAGAHRIAALAREARAHHDRLPGSSRALPLGARGFMLARVLSLMTCLGRGASSMASESPQAQTARRRSGFRGGPPGGLSASAHSSRRRATAAGADAERRREPPAKVRPARAGPREGLPGTRSAGGAEVDSSIAPAGKGGREGARPSQAEGGAAGGDQAVASRRRVRASGPKNCSQSRVKGLAT